MKKSKIFMTVGALVLAITAVFASKANKKSTGITTAVYLDGPSNYYLKATSDFILTTVGTAQLKMYVYTESGTIIANGALVTNTANNLKVFYK